MIKRMTYLVPDIKPNKWNQQEYCWPRILAYNDKDGKHSDVHGNGHTQNEEKKLRQYLISLMPGGG